MSQSDDKVKVSTNIKIEQHRQMILGARKRGRLSTLGVFARLSGPGWLQSAITLGGGSLSSSLYLGVLVGFSFMWLQPFAMILGVIMMSAISYVTLSAGRRPFRAINEHVSPVLGWGWLIASMMANIVWSMPQFSIATGAIQQNLLPGILGEQAMPDPAGKIVVCTIVLVMALANVMMYIQGGWGVKVFEILIKIMVGSIVICFFGVVIRMSADGRVNWSEILSGLIPNLKLLKEPVKGFAQYISAVDPLYRDFWNNLIVTQQRDVMISSAATAVGINMTFLLPYSMLRKGWGKDFRGLAIFDLSTGLFIPFILATGCVVIASACQFHAVAAPGLMGEIGIDGQPVTPAVNLVIPFKQLVEKRMKSAMTSEEIAVYESLSADERDLKIQAMPEADRQMAAMLVTRDAFNLSDSLEPLTGKGIARYVFGFGVLGMTLNAITMLMLINGLCMCELLNKAPKGWTQRLGSLMVSVGVLGPFFWKEAKMWLAVPTSVFAMVLLPIAYFAFFALMNQKTFMGNDMPRGARRVVWNVLMAVSAGTAALASLWSLWSKLGVYGLILFAGFTLLVMISVFLKKENS